MNEIERFLEQYPVELRALVLQARAIILSVMPAALEQFDPSANLIGYGMDRTYKGLVCGIIIYKTYLNLMFARGASLPDPDRLLRGTGKHARHVQILRAAHLEEPGVRALLNAAIQARLSHNSSRP